MFKEIEYKAASGYGALLVALVLSAGSFYGLYSFAQSPHDGSPFQPLAYAFVILISIVMLGGLFTVEPNDARALVLFGQYKGTVKTPGLFWANPFLTKKRVSLRVRNFETAKLKVNDAHSNPIEIGAIVVWNVIDAAEALFEVDDYEKYVIVQCESALRALASQYPYDAHEDGATSLSTNPVEVAHALKVAIDERLQKAGVSVVDARISHLAYAPEIAQAMLQRQQASAIIAARSKIVEGAVGMVENALALLSQRGIVELDAERKASMVSNLLVVLCSERSTQPVVNTGSLYP
jgi:regulator of protease activity HflC (stomatin/prohibitin superfamily)